MVPCDEPQSQENDSKSLRARRKQTDAERVFLGQRYRPVRTPMPRYHFHIDNGEFTVDKTGTDFPDLETAKLQAVRAAGQMIMEIRRSFWESQTPWVMNVTDEQGQLAFTLMFAAKVPSGEAIYVPAGWAADTE